MSGQRNGPRSGPVVDLRSDTVSRPTAAMRRAMADAEVGDDVYGEDPTVDRLGQRGGEVLGDGRERRGPELLGHEAGVFTGSGSLPTQLGIRMLFEPGRELLCEQTAHVAR